MLPSDIPEDCGGGNILVRIGKIFICGLTQLKLVSVLVTLGKPDNRVFH